MPTINKKSPYNFHVEYQLPNLCALCANELPGRTWKIAQQETDSRTNYDLVKGIVTTNTHRDLAFEVGVCYACYAVLENDKQRRQKKLWILRGVFVLIGIIGFLGLVILPIGRGLLTLLLVISLPTLRVMYALAIWFLLPEKSIASRSSDGKKFTFRNKKYQAAFAELNPKLVYQRPRQPITEDNLSK